MKLTNLSAEVSLVIASLNSQYSVAWELDKHFFQSSDSYSNMTSDLNHHNPARSAMIEILSSLGGKENALADLHNRIAYLLERVSAPLHSYHLVAYITQ